MSTEDPYQAFARPDPASIMEVRNYGPTTYATVITNAVASVETPVIGETLQELLVEPTPGLRHLVLDLENVTLLNSMALSMLLMTFSAAQNKNVQLILSGVSDSILDLLTTTKLVTLLPVCTTADQLEAALRA